MIPPTHAIACLGRIAADWLAQAVEAAVGGVTSRGLFLRLPGERLVFLSVEAHRGPLTLNLLAGRAALPDVAVHDPVQIEPGALCFPTTGARLSLATAAYWEAPRPAAPPQPAEVYRPRLLAVAAETAAAREAELLAATLPEVIETPLTGVRVDWPAKVTSVRQALAGGAVPAIAAALEAFLGLGGGLTPSGDDCVLGCLLALNRWGRWLAPDLEVAALNAHLLPAARRKTTTLSACLIECAAQGQADERLVAALDGLLTGAPDVAVCVAGLRSWGSASGLDALAGMALVLAQQPAA
jgi:hypothetical protein